MARADGSYPVTYRLQGRIVPFLIILSGAIMACGFAFVLFSLSRMIVQSRNYPVPSLQFGIMGVAVAAVGVWLILATFRYRMVIDADSIEEQYLLRTRRLCRAGIAGKRIYPRGGGVFIKTVVIHPVDRVATVMKIEMLFKNTEAFDGWISSVPDLESSPLEWRRSIRFRQYIGPALMFGFLVGVPIIYSVAKFAWWHLHA
jgi:hypothetical protein